ncbi:MAG TPA: hypothetical protein VEC57_04000 [Candidatus Limnocylindrales bacterium]|nr:hypothetical protein [Candidatus Limnocylindrales bacterium]
MQRYYDASKHERCQSCGRRGAVAERTAAGKAICGRCYQRKRNRDASTFEPCSRCRKLGPVVVRTATGKAVCAACYSRALAPCSVCSRRRRPAKRTPSGKPICAACLTDRARSSAASRARATRTTGNGDQRRPSR